MDMDFAVSCPLVRRWRLISGFCPSTRTFAPCFFQTPPRGGSPRIITRPSPPSGWPEDFHLQTAEHAQHTTKPPCGGRVTPRDSVLLRSGWDSLWRRFVENPSCKGVPMNPLRQHMLQDMQIRNLA